MITVNEKSTLKIGISLTDENGAVHDISSVISCRWQLSDSEGGVINNRSFENGLISASPIVLTGDDLVSAGRNGYLLLCVKIVYDSSSGTNLTATQEMPIRVIELVNVS